MQLLLLESNKQKMFSVIATINLEILKDNLLPMKVWTFVFALENSCKNQDCSMLKKSNA